jgi:hypothetical protein
MFKMNLAPIQIRQFAFDAHFGNDGPGQPQLFYSQFSLDD